MSFCDAIIFDMDGVLFDTEPLHSRAWQSALREFGLEYPLAEFNQWIGIPDVDLGQYLDRKHPADHAPGLYLERKRSHFVRLLREELIPFAGLPPLLLRLTGVCRIGLATSSHRGDMELMLSLTSMTSHFAVTSCFEDVSNHKPHPAPYLLAASRLGVNPVRCLALDDSPSGVKSALAAGMQTWGITTSFPASKLECAHRIFPSTREACEYILSMRPLS